MKSQIKISVFIGCLMLSFAMGCSRLNNGELIFVEPETHNGFNFPYFIFVPDNVSLNEKVMAVAAGGLNGLLMLPVDTLENEALNYPIGTNDLKKITNKSFAKDLFIKTPQFYFMGKLDKNDAIPYSDAFGQDERKQIYKILGKQMMPGRWENCKSLYKTLGVNAKIETYNKVGHEHPEEIKKIIVDFFREVCNKN